MKKPLKIAAYSGLVFLIVTVMSIIFPFGTLASKIYLVIIAAVGIIFMSGFFVLGKKYKNKFLIVMTWIGIVTLIITLLFFLFPNTFISKEFLQSLESSGEPTPDQISLIIKYSLLVWVIVAALLGLATILFGVALLKIGKKIKYAKSAGILNIVAGATFVIFIGFLVILAANVLEILLLFEASEKFESERKKR